jgi:hypothetical protein
MVIAGKENFADHVQPHFRLKESGGILACRSRDNI